MIETVTVATPLALSAGVNVSVPFGAMAGWPLNRALSSLVTVKMTVWPDSSAGPVLIEVAKPGTVAAPESSSTVWSAPTENDGASLTAVTSMVIVFGVGSRLAPPSAVLPSSWTWKSKLKTAEPLSFAAGT